MEQITIKGTAASVAEYLQEMRKAYGHGAKVADVLRNPQKATTAAAIFQAVEDINKKIKKEQKI